MRFYFSEAELDDAGGAVGRATWYAAALWWIRRSEARPAAVAAPRAPRAPRLLKYKSVEGEGAAPEGFEL